MVKKAPIRFLLLLVLEAIQLVSDGGAQTSPPGDSAFYQISIPEVVDTATAESYLRLPSTDVRRIKIQVQRPEADQLNYGQIHLLINGAAAARITEIRPNALGKLILVDLQARPGFDLLPGPNKVEVLTAGQQLPRKTFTLHTPKGLCSNGSEKILSVEKLTDALRNGVASERMVDWVLDCGIDFTPTTDIETKLRDAGAEDRLIRAINHPTEPDFADRLRNALSVEKIVEFVRSGVSEEELKEQVEDHGVSFQFTDDVRKKLEAVNISRSLEELIAEMAGGTMPGGLRERDITLLLQNGGPNKIVKLVQERGISFRMDAKTEGRFRSAHANERVIEALTAASDKYEASH